MEVYEAKFCYLIHHKPGPFDFDFKITITAVSQADAADMATVIAQSQKQPAYVVSVEPTVAVKQTYGDAACFRYDKGVEMTVKRILGSHGEEFILTLTCPPRDELAIILDSDAWEALCRWRTDSETGYEIGAAEAIIARVAKKHRVRPQDIQSNKKLIKLVEARREALYRVRKETNLTVVKIGDLFNVDNATVLNAVRMTEKKRAGRKARKEGVV